MIAILKNIEKTQTKPGLLMLNLLLEERSISKPAKMEKKKMPPAEDKTQQQLALEISRLEDVLKSTLKDLEYLLEHVEVKGNAFGSDYLKLNIPRTEFEQFKVALKRRT